MLMPSASLRDGMELEQVHVGLDRQGQAGNIPAAPFLVDLQELGDLGRHGIRRLGGSADRANPVAQFPLLDPPGFTEVDQFDALATDVADLEIADLERLAATVPLAEPPQDADRHREPQVLVLGDPALVGQVQVGQRQGVDGHAARLTVGGIARLLGDVALLHVHPQRANAGRFVGPQVIAGDVERAPVGIQPVAGDELPQGHHVAAGEIERPWAGAAGETTSGRGRDAALVDAVARQEPFDAQHGQRVGRSVAPDDRVDELVAPPQQLLFFPLDQARRPSSGAVRQRVDLAHVRRRCSRLMTVIQFVGRLVNGLFDGGAVGQFRRFLRPVLGEEGHQPIGQRVLHLVEQTLPAAPCWSAFPGSGCPHPAGRCE